MKAIRVRKRGRGAGYAVHWLLDPERTYCGRKPAELDVVEELELELLPGVEGCRGCERFADGWTKPDKAQGEFKVTLPASTGVLRTSGPLRHGTRRRLGRRL